MNEYYQSIDNSQQKRTYVTVRQIYQFSRKTYFYQKKSKKYSFAYILSNKTRTVTPFLGQNMTKATGDIITLKNLHKYMYPCLYPMLWIYMSHTHTYMADTHIYDSHDKKSTSEGVSVRKTDNPVRSAKDIILRRQPQ